MRRKLFLAVLFLCMLGVSTSASAQETLSILNGSGDQIVLAQSKSKKKKKDKDDDKEDEDSDEEGGEGEEGEEEGAEGEEAASQSATLQRGNRMEFDGRLIRGETAGSGAVFLFQRAPRPLPSMVQKRESYLGNTVRTVLGREKVEQFEKTKVEAKKEIEKEGESKKLKGKQE